MAKTEWMQEEEERLIRLDQELDSIAGAHRHNCDVCWDAPEHDCGFDGMAAQASAILTKMTRINQDRQDQAKPLPHYSPMTISTFQQFLDRTIADSEHGMARP